MSSIINSNINSLTAQTNLSRSQASLSTSISRLSSGLRINSSADDAAGYAIAQGFTSQINGTNQAIRNASDGVSLAQTAGGALNQTTADLQRIRQLAVQSTNATNSAADRSALQQEVSQLTGDIGSIGNTTQFNGLNLLDGSFHSQSFQVGANVGNTINVSVSDARSQSLGSKTLESGAGVITGSATGVTTAVLTGNVKVNGSTVDTSSASNVADIVADINNSSSTTGVTATRALSNVNTVAYTADATNANTLNLNGVNISLAAGTTGTQAATAINNASAQTGVSATFSGGSLTLTSANAGDVTIKDDATNGVLGAVNGGASVAKKDVTLSAGIVLSGVVTGSSPTAAEGTTTTGKDLNLLSSSTAAGVNKTYQVSTVDVSTAATAQKAIQTIDFALQQVAASSAQLGSIQNRFTATVSNLQTTSTNLSASRSTIQDADFASETANLTRTQVLQQAGTAVLAQANQIPNQVLALLR